MLEGLCFEKNQSVEKLRSKRGYANMTHAQKQKASFANAGFIPKMATIAEVYASRLTLKITDVQKLDYETLAL